jgi:hypothetical protein
MAGPGRQGEQTWSRSEDSEQPWVLGGEYTVGAESRAAGRGGRRIWVRLS